MAATERSRRLQLVHDEQSDGALGPVPQIARGGRCRPGERRQLLALPVTDRLRSFAASAATRGLSPDQAIGLAVERYCALRDLEPLGFRAAETRGILGAAAAGARITRPLGPALSGYVRELGALSPVPNWEMDAQLTVSVSLRILGRSGTAIPQATFDSEAIEEMIAWERAAALSARTMLEWAALTILRHKPRAE